MPLVLFWLIGVGLLGSRVWFGCLLVFLDFAHLPARVTASGRCLIDDLFFLLFGLELCDDRVFPIVEGCVTTHSFWRRGWWEENWCASVCDKYQTWWNRWPWCPEKQWRRLSLPRKVNLMFGSKPSCKTVYQVDFTVIMSEQDLSPIAKYLKWVFFTLDLL